MYNRPVRATLIGLRNLTSLRLVAHHSPQLHRLIFTQPPLAISSLWEDKAPNEARGTRPPFKPSLDYVAEITIDFKNFRDLCERFEEALKENRREDMTSIASTLVYEVSKYSTGKELSVYKSLVANGLGEAAEKDRENCSRLQEAFLKVDKAIGSHSGNNEFVATVQDACGLLLDHVKNEEQSQQRAVTSVLNGSQRSKLAMEYLKAREMAPKRPRPTGTVSSHVLETLSKPADAVAGALRSYVDLKHTHSDPSLA